MTSFTVHTSGMFPVWNAGFSCRSVSRILSSVMSLLVLCSNLAILTIRQPRNARVNWRVAFDKTRLHRRIRG